MAAEGELITWLGPLRLSARMQASSNLSIIKWGFLLLLSCSLVIGDVIKYIYFKIVVG